MKKIIYIFFGIIILASGCSNNATAPLLQTPPQNALDEPKKESQITEKSPETTPPPTPSNMYINRKYGFSVKLAPDMKYEESDGGDLVEIIKNDNEFISARSHGTLRFIANPNYPIANSWDEFKKILLKHDPPPAAYPLKQTRIGNYQVYLQELPYGKEGGQMLTYYVYNPGKTILLVNVSSKDPLYVAQFLTVAETLAY